MEALKFLKMKLKINWIKKKKVMTSNRMDEYYEKNTMKSIVTWDNLLDSYKKMVL